MEEENMAEENIILDFYGTDEGISSGGYTFNMIMRANNQALEYHHDYIQDLFPLPESSMVIKDAPIVTPEVRKAFLEHHGLRERLAMALERMLQFYGFGLNPSWTVPQLADMDNKSSTSGKEEDVDEEVKHEEVDHGIEEDDAAADNDEDDEDDVDEREVGKARREALMGPGANFKRRATMSWLKTVDHNHLRITRIIRSLRVLGLNTLAQAFWHALVEADTEDKVSARSKTYWQRAATRPLWLAPSDADDAEGILWLREELEVLKKDEEDVSAVVKSEEEAKV